VIANNRIVCAFSLSLLVAVAGSVIASPANAQSSAEELAKKLANPVAALISVPFQLNYDQDIGPARGGDRWTLNIQPVVPIDLNADWNLISRTILPVISQDEIYPGAGGQNGIGDVVQSLFFSPKQPTAGGWIWGVGPVFLLPTASDSAIGTEKWGAGPTAVVLKQENGWTYGALANHIWSYAGDDSRADVNATFLQPFLSYTTKTYTTFSLNTESTYDWDAEQWTVPVNVLASQLVKFGKQPVSFGLGYRDYVEAPTGGPDWGLRFVVTFLFPK